jgi:hypothetical protein
MRSLAHVEKVAWKRPIEGKDRIEQIGVLGWGVIVKKDEFEVGDKVVYVEIDSQLPEREEFEFLRAKKFRIKTMKMSGVLSQGICFPLSILKKPADKYEVGADVTEELGITKFEPDADLPPAGEKPRKKQSRFMKFMLRYGLTRRLLKLFGGNKALKKAWPAFITKTDETRVQAMPWVLDNKDIHYEVTEKVDGQSGTFFMTRTKSLFGDKFEYGVCSRNLRLPSNDGTSYWQVSYRYHIDTVLEKLLKYHYPKAKWICIQGECIAPNVQKNKYHVTEPDLYCFNLIVDGQKIDSLDGKEIVEKFGLKWVPILLTDYVLPDTVDELIDAATGQSQLYPTLREGWVLRNYAKGISFKAVSNEFLLKWKE